MTPIKINGGSTAESQYIKQKIFISAACSTTWPFHCKLIKYFEFKLIKLWGPPVLFHENAYQGEASLSAWAYGYLNLAYFIENVSNSIHWNCHSIGIAAYTLQYCRVYGDTPCQRAVQHRVLHSSRYWETYKFLPHLFQRPSALNKREGVRRSGYAEAPDHAVSLACLSMSLSVTFWNKTRGMELCFDCWS